MPTENKKLSEATLISDAGNVNSNFQLPFFNPNTANYRMTFTTLLAWIRYWLNDMVTLTGIQTLTNKRLTSPKINENVELIATSTELNHCDGLSDNVETRLVSLNSDIGSINSSLSAIDSSIGDLEDADTALGGRVTNLETGMTYQWSKTFVASSTTYTVDASEISQLRIDGRNVSIMLYSIDSLNRIGIDNSNISFSVDINDDLDEIALAVVDTRSYLIVVQYSFYDHD